MRAIYENCVWHWTPSNIQHLTSCMFWFACQWPASWKNANLSCLYSLFHWETLALVCSQRGQLNWGQYGQSLRTHKRLNAACISTVLSVQLSDSSVKEKFPWHLISFVIKMYLILYVLLNRRMKSTLTWSAYCSCNQNQRDIQRNEITCSDCSCVFYKRFELFTVWQNDKQGVGRHLPCHSSKKEHAVHKMFQEQVVSTMRKTRGQPKWGPW